MGQDMRDYYESEQRAKDRRSAEVLDALKECVSAMRNAIDAGCVEHLDACDDGGAFWNAALERARKVLA